MRLDMITIIVMSVTICVPVTILLFLSWLQNRADRSLLWWSGSFLANLVGLILFAPRGRMSELVTIDLANALVLAGISLGLAGARSFNGRGTPIWVIALAPALWLAACRVPGFYEMGPWRVVWFAVVNGAVAAAIAIEYWRGRGDGLAARHMLTATFAMLTVIYLGRIVLVAVMPFQDPRDYLDSNLWATISILGPIVIGISNAVLVLGISKERAEAAQRHLAEIDPLTRVANRGATLRRIESELKRVEPGRGAILLFDLDHFKLINDRYGHPAGDQMLRQFAEVAVSHLRDGDIFGRIGGEEFVAFLANAGHDNTLAVAERIREAFAESGVAGDGAQIRATVSIGIAVVDDTERDVDQLLSLADKALYDAKEAGRDQVRAVKPFAA